MTELPFEAVVDRTEDRESIERELKALSHNRLRAVYVSDMPTVPLPGRSITPVGTHGETLRSKRVAQ